MLLVVHASDEPGRLLRRVLRDLTGHDDHVFTRTCATCGGPHGKPVLQHTELHTSRSSAGGLAVVAVTDAGPCGVDVELDTATGFEGFDDVALGPTERASGVAQRARTWTRKEAVLKATGHGLAVDPRTVDVGDPTGPGTSAHGAELYDVAVPTGWTCSVAVLGPRQQLEVRGLTAPAAPARPTRG